MILTEGMKAKIEELYNITPDDVHGVSLGYKYRDGVNTGRIGIVFNVIKKQNISDLKPSDVLPSTITIDGVDMITDVVEASLAMNLSCYINKNNPPYQGFVSTDTNITRLQGFQGPLLTPMKGGQQITQYPTAWQPVSGTSRFSFTVGTLGLLCLDSIDSRVVGLTNSHVLIYRNLIATARDTTSESIDPYNIYHDMTWAGDGNKYPPGVVAHNVYPNFNNVGRLKRYIPIVKTGLNYVDAAIYMPVDSYIDVESSYNTWHRSDDDYYTNKPIPPFATTSEIDGLIAWGRRISSTGRTTGPKGFAVRSANCELKITGLGVAMSVSQAGTILNYGDVIAYQHVDGSLWPSAGGDSGSALIAEIDGVEKIIGICFAGNGGSGFACRIDRVAQELRIEAYSSTHNTTAAVPRTYTISLTDPRANQATITIDGKIYYQAGLAATPTPTPTPTP